MGCSASVDVAHTTATKPNVSRSGRPGSRPSSATPSSATRARSVTPSERSTSRPSSPPPYLAMALTDDVLSSSVTQFSTKWTIPGPTTCPPPIALRPPLPPSAGTKEAPTEQPLLCTPTDAGDIIDAIGHNAVDRQTSCGAASSYRQQDNECSICLAAFEEGDTVRLLSCGHHYHTQCVDRWLAQVFACPYCACSSPLKGEQGKRWRSMVMQPHEQMVEQRLQRRIQRHALVEDRQLLLSAH